MLLSGHYIIYLIEFDFLKFQHFQQIEIWFLLTEKFEHAYAANFSANSKWKNCIRRRRKDVVGKQKLVSIWKIIHHSKSKLQVKEIGFQKLRDLLNSGNQKKVPEIFFPEAAVRRCSSKNTSRGCFWLFGKYKIRQEK